MILGALDPGLRTCGYSIWDEGQLQWAGLVVSPERQERGPKAWLAMARAVLDTYPLGLDHLVVELQQIYPGGYGPPPDDLMQLTGVVGCVVGLYEGRCGLVEGYYPRQWSGGTPKDIRQARLLEPGVLSAEEWERVEPCAKSLYHNVLDSIDLGLWVARLLGERSVNVLSTEAA